MSVGEFARGGRIPASPTTLKDGIFNKKEAGPPRLFFLCAVRGLFFVQREGAEVLP